MLKVALVIKNKIWITNFSPCCRGLIRFFPYPTWRHGWVLTWFLSSQLLWIGHFEDEKKSEKNRENSCHVLQSMRAHTHTHVNWNCYGAKHLANVRMRDFLSSFVFWYIGNDIYNIIPLQTWPSKPYGVSNTYLIITFACVTFAQNEMCIEYLWIVCLCVLFFPFQINCECEWMIWFRVEFWLLLTKWEKRRREEMCHIIYDCRLAQLFATR